LIDWTKKNSQMFKQKKNIECNFIINIVSIDDIEPMKYYEDDMEYKEIMMNLFKTKINIIYSSDSLKGKTKQCFIKSKMETFKDLSKSKKKK
jgi:hypothetical protein